MKQQYEDWELEEWLLSCIGYKNDGEMNTCDVNDDGGNTAHEQMDFDGQVDRNAICNFDDSVISETFLF